MEIENHKEEVPFAFYEEKFHALRPEEVVARLSDAHWDGTEFTVRLLGRDFAITHPDYAIRALDGGTTPPLPAQTSCSATSWKAGMSAGAASGRPSGKCPGEKCTSNPIPAGG